MKEKKISFWIILAFLCVPLIVSFVSAYHVLAFFELSNNFLLSFVLAFAFELGALAALAGLIIMSKVNQTVMWLIFIGLTLFQCHGNIYYAYNFVSNNMVTIPGLIKNWMEMFNLDATDADDIMYAKRMISYIAGGILPLISLGFLHMLVSYLNKLNILDNNNDAKNSQPSETSLTADIDTSITPDKDLKKKELDKEKEEDVVEITQEYKPDIAIEEKEEDVIEVVEITQEDKSDMVINNNANEYIIQSQTIESDTLDNKTEEQDKNADEELVKFDDLSKNKTLKKYIYLKLLSILFKKGETSVEEDLYTFAQFKEESEKNNLKIELDIYKDFLTKCNFYGITEVSDKSRRAIVSYSDAKIKMESIF